MNETDSRDPVLEAAKVYQKLAHRCLEPDKELAALVAFGRAVGEGALKALKRREGKDE